MVRHPNAIKTFLLVKENIFNSACELFDSTGVNITVEGVCELGCPIESESFVTEQIEAKVGSWCKDVKMLAEIAETQPQAAYRSFVHSVFGRWTYFFHTCPLEEN